MIGQFTSDKPKGPALLQRSPAQKSLDEDVFAEASKIDKIQVTSKDNERQTAVTLGEPSDQAGYELVGSKTSDKYHKLICPSAAKIKQKVYFKSAEDAKKKGYKPCKTCNP